MRFVGLLVIVWLIVGAVAAYQRGYFTNAAQNCASAGTIAVTVDRGTTQLRGCQSKSDGLSSAATQSITPTAQFQPI